MAAHGHGCFRNCSRFENKHGRHGRHLGFPFPGSNSKALSPIDFKLYRVVWQHMGMVAFEIAVVSKTNMAARPLDSRVRLSVRPSV
jgi:hypothetical protein